jgi:hypothetical protein
VTPHILTRKTRLRPRNFLINDAKGLLQQYPSKATVTHPEAARRQGPKTEVAVIAEVGRDQAVAIQSIASMGPAGYGCLV